MTLDELTAQIKAAGIFPIPVENNVPDDESEGLLVAGGLQAYLEALKAVRSTYVLIFSESLELTDFSLEGESELSEDEEDTPDESVDLRTIDPSLKPFERHLGEHGVFYLSACVGPAPGKAMPKALLESFTEEEESSSVGTSQSGAHAPGAE